MKFSILLFMSLFFTLPLYAQVDSIELPYGEETMQVNSRMQFFSIYVDSKNQVYFENELIPIETIGKVIYTNTSKIPQELQMVEWVYLYIDKNAKYNIVDQLKTKLASAGIVNIFYKTKSMEDMDLLNGIFSKNHESISKIFDSEEEQEAEFAPLKENDSLGMNPPMPGLDMIPPPPPPMFWDFELQEQMYKLNQKAISDLLDDKSYQCVTLTNKGIQSNSKVIDFDNVLGTEKLFQNNELLLVKFDENLDYENYFKTLRLLKATKKKLGNKTGLLELSSELINAYKINNIKICD